MRWVNCARNEISPQNRENVLKMLHTVAHAQSAPGYEAAVKALHQSEEWKTAPLLQTWFNKKWLPNHKVLFSNCWNLGTSILGHRLLFNVNVHQY